MKYAYIDHHINLKVSWDSFLKDLAKTSYYSLKLSNQDYYETIKIIFLSILENKNIILSDDNILAPKQKPIIHTKLNSCYPKV